MRLTGFIILLLCFTAARSQDLTGIWRGSFISADSKLTDLFSAQDRYKYEVQIDQHGKAFDGVTYSYKTTVFYGKASANGTVNPKTGKVMLQELKLLELKMTPDNFACWMVCFLQYSKNGDEEFLEGKYSSYRETDSSYCGRGTVYLRKVVTSDFYREPFLAKREKEKAIAKSKPVTVDSTRKAPAVKPPSVTGNPPIRKEGSKPPSKPVQNQTATSNPKPRNGHPAPSKNAPTTPLELRHAPAPSDLKEAPIVSRIDTSKKSPSIKKMDATIIPLVLKSRENELIQTINVTTGEVHIDIYDNGTIDHDTISVYLDKKLVISHEMLKETPISLTLKLDDVNNYHELIMVAENLGDIPPNTSLMVINAGDQHYDVRITSTEQKNAVVIFKYSKPK
jgi:hypothetical protein